jgi:hypothetical protein
VTKLVWAAFCAALIPIKLSRLPFLLPAFLSALERTDDNSKRPRQIDAFLAGLGHASG